jgi:hypothetical protein
MGRHEKVSALLSSAVQGAQKRAAEVTRTALRGGIDAATNAAQKVVDLVTDPAVLADMIIASTAAQESVNEILRERKSIYRIGEVQISIGLQPQVTFAISRLGDLDASSSSAIIDDAVEA